MQQKTTIKPHEPLLRSCSGVVPSKYTYKLPRFLLAENLVEMLVIFAKIQQRALLIVLLFSILSRQQAFNEGLDTINFAVHHRDNVTASIVHSMKDSHARLCGPMNLHSVFSEWDHNAVCKTWLDFRSIGNFSDDDFHMPPPRHLISTRNVSTTNNVLTDGDREMS